MGGTAHITAMSSQGLKRGESEQSAGGRTALTRRRSSFLSEISRELSEPPVQRSYVFSDSRASLAGGGSQLGAVEEKGEGSAEEGVNLLSEIEPDHRTGGKRREGAQLC